MKSIALSKREVTQIDRLLDSILNGSPAVEIDSLLIEASILSHELPKRIRRIFYEFKLLETTFALCVKNNPINPDLLGKTPDHLDMDEIHSFATRQEVLHVLYSSLLGEIFAWSTQMGGRIINDIMPLRQYEKKPISLGSKHQLDLHTEDAFHPFMPDYFGLMCLRNPDRVATMISSIDSVALDRQTKQILFEPRYIVKANLAQRINIPDSDYRPIAVLFGHEESPYMRINTVSMHAVDGDEEARIALDCLVQGLRGSVIDVELESGDCLYINNYKTVHGRRPHNAKYDGTDRWLKRIYVTSDLRKSRALRNSPQARIITPSRDSVLHA